MIWLLILTMYFDKGQVTVKLPYPSQEACETLIATNGLWRGNLDENIFPKPISIDVKCVSADLKTTHP